MYGNSKYKVWLAAFHSFFYVRCMLEKKKAKVGAVTVLYARGCTSHIIAVSVLLYTFKLLQNKSVQESKLLLLITFYGNFPQRW